MRILDRQIYKEILFPSLIAPVWDSWPFYRVNIERLNINHSRFGLGRHFERNLNIVGVLVPGNRDNDGRMLGGHL
jgi:hypothetical protein